MNRDKNFQGRFDSNGRSSSTFPDIILATRTQPTLRDALEKLYLVHELDEECPQARVLVTSASAGVASEQLARYPDLELIAVFGVGLDGIDLELCHERGITVTNTPGVLDGAVAEHALALTLTAWRRVREADEFVRQGEWTSHGFPLTRGLSGKRCGIVGLGRIGRRIAELVTAFGMKVAYHGRQEKPDAPYTYMEDLWDLASISDVLILALPGGVETEGLIDAVILQALGADGLLVNVARGSVVDQQALVEALEYGDLGGAALDVFWDEPEVPQELLRLPNVVLTPHLASATEETRQAMLDLTLENVRAHFYPSP